MYYTYLLKNAQGGHYTGSTADLEERLKMHNDLSPEKARFHRTTYKKGPWKIIFTKEFQKREEALKFERFLKTGRGREWFKNNMNKGD